MNSSNSKLDFGLTTQSVDGELANRELARVAIICRRLFRDLLKGDRLTFKEVLLMLAITVSFCSPAVDAQETQRSETNRDTSADSGAHLASQLASLAEFNEIDRDQIRTLPELESVISSAPPAFLRLVDQGKVRMTRNDDLLREQRKSAMTLFWFQVKFRQSINYRVKNRNADGSIDLLVQTRYRRGSYSISHLIVLPGWFDIESAWRSKLLQHEFDHVAITTDPRAKKLAEAFLWQSDDWTYRINAGEQFSQDDLEAQSKQRFEDRKLVYQKMLQAIYDQLDDVSEQGQRDIDARKEFFSRLFEAENLREIEFPISSPVRKKIKSRNYSRIDRHYELIW